MSAAKTPTFNLKAVVRETNLKPDTLRAWERRYGLPQPQRTPGGHRLYSQRDIETIKWLAARQQEGLSISRAVDLWRSLEAEGQDPLHVAEYEKPEAGVTVVSLPEGDALAELRQGWVSACMAFDEQRAEQILAQAFALYPTEVVCFELLQTGLAEAGEGWYRGEVTVQQEHFASELAVRRLEALMAATPPPTRPGRILVGCPPQEEHIFSPLLLTLLLRRRGWEVVYLGANVPLARMETTITMTQPKLVILSAQQIHTAATLLDMARLLQQERVPLSFGGRVFNWLPLLHNRIPGHFLGERLGQAPQVVEHLLSSSPPLPSVEPVPETYRQAAAHYRQRQSLIESQMWQTMAPTGILYDYLTIANMHLARDILAALTLGDMDFLDIGINWAGGLISNYHLPAELLRQFLSAYHQAAETCLDERGAPIVTWLARLNELDSE